MLRDFTAPTLLLFACSFACDPQSLDDDPRGDGPIDPGANGFASERPEQRWGPAVAVQSTSEFDGGGCYHATDRPGGEPLQDIVDAVGPTRVLVVDQACTVDDDLLLPERFTLTGAGWVGSGRLDIISGGGIFLDTGGDDEAHTTIENLEIQGPSSGTAITLVETNQVHLRDLIVRGFATAIAAEESYTVEIDSCNFNNNDVALALGDEANSWRIRGGICSQNDVCMDLHPDGGATDTLVIGVRMESNGTAVAVGGTSTFIAFNRFEGNTTDVSKYSTASGTVLLANNMAPGTVSDLSELNPAGITGLPVVDKTLRMSIVGGGNPTTQLFTGYVATGNLLRTLLMANNTTADGVDIDPSYNSGYAGWQLQMDSSTQSSTSEVSFRYRAPNSSSNPTSVFRVASDGTAYARAFIATSDERLKRDIEPVDGALDRIARLRGVTYAWRTGPAADARSMGLIAQNVEAEFPEAVRTDAEGYKAVSYDQLTAPIVESIKELATRNASLERENAELHKRLLRLERRMAARDRKRG